MEKVFILQKKNEGMFSLKAYSDVDWGKCLDSMRSVSGFCLFFCDSLISQKSKKQPTVSKPSIEPEFRALATTTCEIVWVLKLLKDFRIENLLPATFFYDNKYALMLVANLVFHERSKYLKLIFTLLEKNVHWCY